MALAVAAAALAVLWAGPAKAGTAIQIGQVSPGDPQDVSCNDRNFVQVSVMVGTTSYTVPSDGVITGWSHRGDDSGAGLGRLQVWRPAGGTNYTLVGKSEIQAFDAGVLNIFATNIPVSTGDLLGFRSSIAGTGCSFSGFSGDLFRLDATGSSDPAPGETRDLSSAGPNFRLNVAATLDPADPAPPPPSGDPTSLDSSKTKGKQPVDNLKIKVTVDQDSTLDLGGKAKVAQRKPASTSAKMKNFKLKKKKGIGLQAGVEKKIPLKFKKNPKTVKRIKKLLKRSKKARKRSKVIVNLTATTAAGVASTSKLKIKLKP